MVLELFTNRTGEQINTDDPVSIFFSFDTPDDRFLGEQYENDKFIEGHCFDKIVYVTLRKEDESELSAGILLSKDSVKLLYAALGAYLGK